MKSSKLGLSVVERDHQGNFRAFRSLVTSKMVRFWEDPRDIKLAIHEKILELLRDRELVGWVPGTDAVDTAPLAAEIARLGRENASLRSQLERAPKLTETYNRLTFDELYNLLLQIDLPDEDVEELYFALNQISQAFGDERIGLIHLLWYWRDMLQLGKELSEHSGVYTYALKLEAFALVDIRRSMGEALFTLNQTGKQFLLRLRTVRDVRSVEKYVLKTTSD